MRTEADDLSYRRYLLGVLLLIQASNGVDGLALGLLLQSIKVDLQLTDTQLGFLTGIAFALFYSVMGIPIARWADKGNRVLIISLTAAIWSVMVSLCGIAASFWQLMLIRFGVGIGEAGCVPPANSLIADYFKRAERPRAVAIYMMGGFLSPLLGYFGAGWFNQEYGWRTTFALLGAPGMALSALAWFTLREPRRGDAACAGKAYPTEVIAAEDSFWKTALFLWNNRTFRHLLLCYSVMCFFSYGILQWQPAFFIRSYGFETGKLGSWFALLYGVCGLAGTYLGGEMAARRAGTNERLQLQATAIAICIFGAVSALTYVSKIPSVSLASVAVAIFAVSATNGPMFGVLQTLVPQSMRATSIAIVFLFSNLIGVGLGPLATGALSDALHPLLGQEALRYSLLAMCPGYLVCAWQALRASHTVVSDLVSIQSIEARAAAPL